MKKSLALVVPFAALFFYSLQFTVGCFALKSQTATCQLIENSQEFYKNTFHLTIMPAIIISSFLWAAGLIGTSFTIWNFASHKNTFPKLNSFLDKKSLFSNICMLFSALFFLSPITQIILDRLARISMHPLCLTHILSINIAAPALFLCIIRDEPSRTKAMISFIGSLVITFVGIPVVALVVFPT